MQFVYHERSKEPFIEVEGEVYKYLFRVRRFKRGDLLSFRNLRDPFLYFYRVEEVGKKRAVLKLEESEERVVEPLKELYLFWCVIDPKTIEKTLPMLNEMGVKGITFVYCDRSQKNFRLDFKRFERILINSCMQCGRSSLMSLDSLSSVEEIETKDLYILDFGKDIYKGNDEIKKILVGPEGGFSDREREIFKDLKGISFDTPLILKSETACLAVSSKILL
ncbi:MAG: 16S rRNA (uracil(1498)-N(3))-methyltransferase [Epsilonproteobacteria bacterium]|nr:16S rRNA (uracil(1498)-N(3))-methyltransferase [Campylobacterota bacterium]